MGEKVSAQPVDAHGGPPHADHDIRVMRDSCLRADVDRYMAKNGVGPGHLAAKLLDGHFAHFRYTDPEYPA